MMKYWYIIYIDFYIERIKLNVKIRVSNPEDPVDSNPFNFVCLIMIVRIFLQQLNFFYNNLFESDWNLEQSWLFEIWNDISYITT